jgi:uroporphyrin-3 C-methyltransferase
LPAPPESATVADVPAPPAAAAPSVTPPPQTTTLTSRTWLIGAAVVGALSVASLTLALLSQQRVKVLEQELVRRQQESQGQAVEARALAKQASELVQATDSKVALLEGRVAETALQRTQLEELIQQLSRSRDENVLADIDAAIRVALQQVAITGSAEPMTSALRQAEERLARINQPRMERVRRALARDIDRVKSVALADIASLSIKLDESVRMVDELPVLSQPDRRVAAATPATSAKAGTRVPATSASAPLQSVWLQAAQDAWTTAVDRVWVEVKSLVRVTRIDRPEAMLVAPEQAWFLRENLKLRLLNARLALQSRQFDTVQSDLQDAQTALDRYFDRSSRRVVAVNDLLRQVNQLARQVSVPRPDETLAAIAAAQAGR